MSLVGIFTGLVEANNDPRRLGRLKVRVPHVYGASVTGAGYIGTNDLPWAIPAGMPAGGSSASGGLSMIPETGDQVMVQFLDGEPEKPVWQWLMQTSDQANRFKLHSYASKEGSAQVAGPNRAILTRYGHSLELTKDGVTLTTSQGYQILLRSNASETGGSVSMQTPAGQRVTANDLSKSTVLQALDAAVISANSVILNAAANTLLKSAGTLTMMVGGTLITIKGTQVVITTGSGAAIIIDADGNIALTSATGASVAVQNSGIQIATPDGTGMSVKNGTISFSGGRALFNTNAVAIGSDALYAPVLLTPSLLAWILAHTHTNGNNGSPTGPPIPIDPAFPQNSASNRMKAS